MKIRVPSDAPLYPEEKAARRREELLKTGAVVGAVGLTGLTIAMVAKIAKRKE